MDSTTEGFVKCNIPIIVLNIGLIYLITTIYYFFMNNINSDPILEILEPFPKLLEHYKEKKDVMGRNLLFGICIGVAVIYFIKPFGKYF